MALIRNAANRVLNGRVGDTTYYTSLRRQVARQALNSSNYGESARRTPSQQSRRILWANLVNFYKLSRNWMPAAFESKGVGVTDYNRFMSVNLKASRIALTKSLALQGACVIDEFIVSQGSIPSVEIIKVGSTYKTNLALGQLVIGDTTTIAELTTALMAYNAQVQNGMQISFVSYQQSIQASGLPLAICSFYEITLDRFSTELVRDYLPVFCSQSVQQCLGTSDNISMGGFTYILSDRRDGQVRVSSQSLVTNNSSLISRYSSAQAISEAIASYGVDKEVLLAPGSFSAENPTAQPDNLVYFQSSRMSAPLYSGQTALQRSAFATAASDKLNIKVSGFKDAEIVEVDFGFDSNEWSFDSSEITFANGIITITVGSAYSSIESYRLLLSILVRTSTGDEYHMNFTRPTGGGGDDHD